MPELLSCQHDAIARPWCDRSGPNGAKFLARHGLETFVMVGTAPTLRDARLFAASVCAALSREFPGRVSMGRIPRLGWSSSDWSRPRRRCEP
jgi:hypothetical protein